MANYQAYERRVTEWIVAANGEFFGWHWSVDSDWTSGTSTVLQEGTEPTLLRAVRAACECGQDGILVARPSASAPQGHDAGSIPYLQGLHGRVEDGWLVQPDRVWPAVGRDELAHALGRDPATLELRP